VSTFFSFWKKVVQFNPHERGKNNSSGLKPEFKKIHLNIFFLLKNGFPYHSKTEELNYIVYTSGTN